MAKEQLTIEELEEKRTELVEQIEQIKKIIDASDVSVFEIIIDDIKKEMEINVAEENWKALKNNKSKIEDFRKIANVISNQDKLLEKKEQELENIEDKLKYYQRTLNDAAKDAEQSINTHIYVKDHGEVSTGAVFGGYIFEEDEDGKGEHLQVYYVVKKSAEIEGKFSILSNRHEGELLLSYPKNKKLLDDAEEYIGNIYNEFDNQTEAVECLKEIAEYQEQFNNKEENKEPN